MSRGRSRIASRPRTSRSGRSRRRASSPRSARAFDWEMSLTGHGEPEVVRAGHVNGTLFRTLGAKPFLGTHRSKTPTTTNAVLSYALWQRKFGGDPHVLGRSIQVDGDTYTIAGVMPREFLVPKSRADLWIPYAIPAQVRGRYLTAIARLAPGVTIEQAQAGMNVVAQRTAAAFPASNARMGAKVIPLHEQVVGSVRRALLIVLRGGRVAAPHRVRQHREPAPEPRDVALEGDGRPRRARRVARAVDPPVAHGEPDPRDHRRTPRHRHRQLGDDAAPSLHARVGDDAAHGGDLRRRTRARRHRAAHARDRNLLRSRARARSIAHGPAVGTDVVEPRLESRPARQAVPQRARRCPRWRWRRCCSSGRDC